MQTAIPTDYPSGRLFAKEGGGPPSYFFCLKRHTRESVDSRERGVNLNITLSMSMDDKCHPALCFFALPKQNSLIVKVPY